MNSQESPERKSVCRASRIELPLRSVVAKALLLLIVGVPAIWLGTKVTQVALAARFGGRMDVHDLKRAIVMDPGNAAYDHQLGLLYAFSLNNADPAKGLRYLRAATEMNPLKALYWADLAEACDANNQPSCSKEALSKALALSPLTPRFEWLAGNHYLQAGHIDQAMHHFRLLLALDDSYARPVFHICLRAVDDPQKVYQSVVPASDNSDLELAFLDSVSKPGDIDFADHLWDQVASHGFSGSFSDVKPYLNCLLKTGNIQQAKRVWEQLENTGAVGKSSADGSGNLVYNGGFEQTPVNGGFDWQTSNNAYVETDFADPSAYQGSRCLRVDYVAGHNPQTEPVSELVPVAPNQTYRLTADVRSEGITSDSGPRLRVVEPGCPGCLAVSTPTTVGTTPWHPVSLDFTTGGKTRVVWLSVWRPRSRTFPMEISGSFWLDNVSIDAVSAGPMKTASLR